MAKIKGWKKQNSSSSYMKWISETNNNHIVIVKYVEDSWYVSATINSKIKLYETTNRKIDANKIAIRYIKNNR